MKLTFLIALLALPGSLAAQIEIVKNPQRPDGSPCPGVGGSIQFRTGGPFGSAAIDESGFAVTRVDSLGPAERVGIAIGDTIVSVNDSSLTPAQWMSRAPGTGLRVRVRRNGTVRDTVLVMGARRTDATGTQRCVPEERGSQRQP